MSDAKASYGAASRLLHRLALGAAPVAEMSFDLEQALTKPDVDSIVDGRHVFVSGLARAGTTLVMRGLHDTGAFRSLTYRDMPFVLMPNLWTRLSGGERQEARARERAHGDGMMVGFDSPEALEEVFWRIFAGEDYLQRDRLCPMAVGPALLEKFRSYIAAILAAGPSGIRYLSKNNNNVLRIPGIVRCFPNAMVLVPFRDPVQQSLSLLRQHKRFSDPAHDDPFTRDYMRWLAHHEFGPGHRPFVFSNIPARFQDPDTLDYWLERWVDCYGFLRDQLPSLGANIHFLSYEGLSSDPTGTAERLASMLDVPVRSLFQSDTITEKKKAADEITVDPDLAARAGAIYDALRTVTLEEY